MEVDLERVQTQLEGELHGLGREVASVKKELVIRTWEGRYMGSLAPSMDM
jgi:hypothetical protein